MKPLTLIIADGYGISPEKRGNAIYAAKKPNIDKYTATCPNALLSASGMDVGLPEGQMGNSEVGHMNIGAGRIVYQELTRISKSIVDGDFFENSAFLAATKNCVDNGKNLHIMGLLSNGGVHSHTSHLYALLKLAKDQGVQNVYIHCFMDGRDTPPDSGLSYIDALQDYIGKIGIGEIATVSGRFYAMDRDKRWDRVEKAYHALVHGEGELFESANDAIKASYAQNIEDEFIIPKVITKNGIPTAKIASGDSMIFYNFRTDRAREITRAFVDPAFDAFPVEKFPLTYICMTQYDESMPNVQVAYLPENTANGLGEYLSACGLTQLRIAETEKYAHVTFFFSCGAEAPYPGESRCLIDSPKVRTYDETPPMSAREITRQALHYIQNQEVDVIILNFANGDMLGHTGIFSAAVEGIETVDQCVGELVTATLSVGGTAIITADHGNAEIMLDENGGVVTAHSTGPVPFILVGPDVKLRPTGRLADIAPTILDLLDLPVPSEMTGETLIIHKIAK